MPRTEHLPDGSLVIHGACPSSIESLHSAIGADGQWLVLSCGASSAVCWSADDPDTSHVLLDAVGGLRPAESLALAVSAQGEEIVLGRGGRGSLWRWDRGSGRLRGTVQRSKLLETHPFGRFPMAVAGSSAQPILCTDSRRGGLQRWDALTGESLGQPMAAGTTHTWAVVTAPWPGQPGELFVSGGSDALIHRWDPVTGLEIGTPISGCGQSTALAVLGRPGGGVMVVVLDAAGLVHRRDLSSGEPVGAPLETGWTPPRSARQNPARGWLAVTGSGDGATGQIAVCTAPNQPILLWDAESGDQLARVDVKQLSTGGIRGLTSARLRDGEPVVLVGDADGRVHRLHARTGKRIGEAASPHGTQPSLAVVVPLVDGVDLLAVVGKDRVYRFDTRTGEPYGASRRPWALAVESLAGTTLPDGRALLVAGTHDGIERFDVSAGVACPRHADEETSTIWDVATVALPGGTDGSDGMVIIAGAGHDALVRRWDAATGQAVGMPLAGHRTSVKAVATAVAFDGTPVIVSGCAAGEVRCWDAASGRQIGDAWQGASSALASLAVLGGAAPADHRDEVTVLLCASDDGFVHSWDLDRRIPFGPSIHVGGWPRILGAFLSPEGAPIAGIWYAEGPHDEAAGFWRLDDGERLEHPRLPQSSIALITLSGQRLTVAGSHDGAVTVARLAL